MEDLREEPELEEREEEEEEEEDEEEDVQESVADVSRDEPQKHEEERGEENRDDQEDEDRLVRDKSARRASLTDEFDSDDTQGLLETNFSVTGLNEIRTERVIRRANDSTGSATPRRPMSLDLNAPIKFRKSRGGTRPERVTAKLISSDRVGFRSRDGGSVAGQVTRLIDDNN
jgi:hypothetical protein